MKRFLFFMFVAIALVACEKESESAIHNVDLQGVVSQNKVSLKQALLYAENSINGISPTTRSAERKVKSTEIYVAKPATRSAEDTEVSFYLINYEDNEGFAMVSTDSRATPVYAYSDEGNLTAEDFETSPFLGTFIEGSIENYQAEVANNIYEPIEWPDSAYSHITRLPIVEYNGGLYYEDNTTETILKENLLTTAWHQFEPYNFFCNTNNIGGCGPVAAAQIMAYHKHPAQYGTTIYNWDAMTATPTLEDGDIGATYAARLIADIGGEAGANYRDNGTGTTSVGIKKAFRALDYNCGHPASYNINRIQENINAEKPIFIDGKDSEGGHAWVIDGYRHQTFRTTYYHTYEPYAMYETFVVSSRTYFHCNLGSCPYKEDYTPNGYYYASSLLYPNDIEVIYDIEPNL